MNQVPRILIPGDNVYLFSMQFIDDQIDTATIHTDTGPHRVYILVIAGNGDFGSTAGLPGNAFDLHRTVLDLCHFLFKETFYQIRMGP